VMQMPCIHPRAHTSRDGIPHRGRA
jgi:hypothetical protein